MVKSMSMHKQDSKGIVKSNFVISCLTFKGLIPILPWLEIELRLPW